MTAHGDFPDFENGEIEIIRGKDRALVRCRYCSKFPEIVKPHSCDVECLISGQNVVKTDRRSSLSPDALRDYLHILINMPDLSEFNYYPAVEAWFEEKKRRPSKNVPVAGAEWYRGVFPRSNK